MKTRKMIGLRSGRRVDDIYLILVNTHFSIKQVLIGILCQNQFKFYTPIPSEMRLFSISKISINFFVIFIVNFVSLCHLLHIM